MLQGWQVCIEHDQWVIRFYDLGGHLIEAGEEMKMVIERFISDGLTLEKVSPKDGCLC